MYKKFIILFGALLALTGSSILATTIFERKRIPTSLETKASKVIAEQALALYNTVLESDSDAQMSHELKRQRAYTKMTNFLSRLPDIHTKKRVFCTMMHKLDAKVGIFGQQLFYLAGASLSQLLESHSEENHIIIFSPEEETAMRDYFLSFCTEGQNSLVAYVVENLMSTGKILSTEANQVNIQRTLLMRKLYIAQKRAFDVLVKVLSPKQLSEALHTIDEEEVDKSDALKHVQKTLEDAFKERVLDPANNKQPIPSFDQEVKAQGDDFMKEYAEIVNPENQEAELAVDFLNLFASTFSTLIPQHLNLGERLTAEAEAVEHDKQKALLRYLVLDYGCQSIESARKMEMVLKCIYMTEIEEELRGMGGEELQKRVGVLLSLIESFYKAYPKTPALHFTEADRYDARTKIMSKLFDMFVCHKAELLVRLLFANNAEGISVAAIKEELDILHQKAPHLMEPLVIELLSGVVINRPEIFSTLPNDFKRRYLGHIIHLFMPYFERHNEIGDLYAIDDLIEHIVIMYVYNNITQDIFELIKPQLQALNLSAEKMEEFQELVYQRHEDIMKDKMAEDAAAAAEQAQQEEAAGQEAAAAQEAINQQFLALQAQFAPLVEQAQAEGNQQVLAGLVQQAFLQFHHLLMEAGQNEPPQEVVAFIQQLVGPGLVPQLQVLMQQFAAQQNQADQADHDAGAEVQEAAADNPAEQVDPEDNQNNAE